jgi:hypothetical protein
MSYKRFLLETIENDEEFRAEANRVIDNVVDFLKANYHDDTIDHRLLVPNNVGGYAFYYFKLDPTYPKLCFQFNPKTNTKVRAGIGRAGEYTVIVIDGILIAPRDLRYINTRIAGYRSAIFHELIHYFDELRFKGSDTQPKSSDAYNSGNETAYYSNPAEFNAYFQELVSSKIPWIDDLRPELRKIFLDAYTIDFVTFRNYVVGDSGVYEKFNDSYKRRFDSRLYPYYRRLKEKYQNGADDEL